MKYECDNGQDHQRIAIEIEYRTNLHISVNYGLASVMTTLFYLTSSHILGNE